MLEPTCGSRTVLIQTSLCPSFFSALICCSYIHNLYSLNVQMQTLEFPLRSKIITPQPSLKWAVLFRQHSTIQHKKPFCSKLPRKGSFKQILRRVIPSERFFNSSSNPSSATGCKSFECDRLYVT